MIQYLILFFVCLNVISFLTYFTSFYLILLHDKDIRVANLVLCVVNLMIIFSYFKGGLS